MAEKLNKDKIAGILGGMGPEATVDLMQRIIRLTPARDDSDHIRCLVDNNPKIPSRIKAIIEGDGEDPGPCIAEMGRRLEAWGADFLAIPCNTAHVYYDRVQSAVRIPVIHLIELTVNHIRDAFPDVSKVGVLASTAVQITGLYSKRFDRIGIETLYPDAKNQENLFSFIRQIKTGDTGRDVLNGYRDICAHLQSLEADIAIVACTELSILDFADPPLRLIDAAELLAQEVIDIAKNRKQA